MSKDQQPIPEYLDAMRPNVPHSDPPDSPTWVPVKKGSKWGAVAGFVLAQFVIASSSIETPVGSIYAGNMLALYAVCIGSCAAFGAAIGWLSARDVDDDGPAPRPDFPQEPFG